MLSMRSMKLITFKATSLLRNKCDEFPQIPLQVIRNRSRRRMGRSCQCRTKNGNILICISLNNECHRGGIVQPSSSSSSSFSSSSSSAAAARSGSVHHWRRQRQQQHQQQKSNSRCSHTITITTTSHRHFPPRRAALPGTAAVAAVSARALEKNAAPV